jgi:phosphoribosylanthranilate isomerase
MRVKICGINSERAFDAVVEAGADYLGFVFFPPSPRAVTPSQAAALSARAKGGPKRVGLFVNPTQASVAEVLADLQLDVLQFHDAGDLALFHQFGLPIWCSHGIRTSADLPASSAGAAELLLDAKPPKDSTRPGGNAVRFDWHILKNWQAPAPWWLAGGLTPENIGEAIRTSGATAVDVSSGVESAPGVKDPARIKSFIARARHPGS